MGSNAQTSQGFKLEIGDTSDSPLEPMTEIKDITGFQMFDGKANVIDITNLQSTAKEKLMGLQDFGSATFDCSHVPNDAGQSEARTAKANKTKKSFKATFSSGATASFSGYVMSNPLSGSVDAKVDGSFNIEIDGDVTFA